MRPPTGRLIFYAGLSRLRDALLKYYPGYIGPVKAAQASEGGQRNTYSEELAAVTIIKAGGVPGYTLYGCCVMAHHVQALERAELLFGADVNLRLQSAHIRKAPAALHGLLSTEIQDAERLTDAAAGQYERKGHTDAQYCRYVEVSVFTNNFHNI